METEMVGIILSSSVLVAIITSYITIKVKNTDLKAQYVIEERKDWRNIIRTKAVEFADERNPRKKEKIMHEIQLRLNPNSEPDNKIIKAMKNCIINTNRIDIARRCIVNRNTINVIRECFRDENAINIFKRCISNDNIIRLLKICSSDNNAIRECIRNNSTIKNETNSITESNTLTICKRCISNDNIVELIRICVNDEDILEAVKECINDPNIIEMTKNCISNDSIVEIIRIFLSNQNCNLGTLRTHINNGELNIDARELLKRCINNHKILKVIEVFINDNNNIFIKQISELLKEDWERAKVEVKTGVGNLSKFVYLVFMTIIYNFYLKGCLNRLEVEADITKIINTILFFFMFMYMFKFMKNKFKHISTEHWYRK